VRELRERVGIGSFNPTLPRAETISADAAAIRLGICVGSVHKLIRKGVLPATQLMQSAPWQIPVATLETEAVTTGVREIVGRRPKFYSSTSAFRRIKPFGSRGSKWKDALCRPIPAFAAENIKIAGMRIALQPLLDLQRQAVHAAPHVADCQPHPNPRGNRDHRPDNALTTAAANPVGIEAGMRKRALPANSISIACVVGHPAPSPTGAIRTWAKPLATPISRRQR
jgi:hypothetical protein